MSLLKQIEDKGAVLEWSPISQFPNLVALGTKDSAGSGFDDHGGELELHSLDFADANSSNSTLLGKARANSRFSSIAWSQMSVNTEEFPYGLIAGGMADGNIHVWDPSRLAEAEEEEVEPDQVDALLASVEQHSGAVTALHFNPHKESSHLLASGGSDAEVFVTSLEHPDQPSVFIPAPPPNNAKHTADVTKVAWNTQVAHILASAAQNGSCYIWDLRQKKAWCELREPSGGLVSDVAWNPDQGLHIVTASGDDKNPVLKLWDLRSSTSLPLATLSGHKEGILSVSWCPSDASLLLSCAKDNRTILWDLFHLQPIYDLPGGDVGGGAGSSGKHASHSMMMGAGGGAATDTAGNNMFGAGLATSANQRRYHVSWSSCLPAVVSTSSFDRKVQFFSMTGAKSRLGRAPKWLRRPCAATFGFGGKLASFTSKAHPAVSGGLASAPTKKLGLGAAQVSIHQVVEDEPFIAASDLFHSTIAKGEYKQFCDLKATPPSAEGGGGGDPPATAGTGAVSEKERQVWSLMNVICFGSNAREELLTHLGFDSASITATAQDYVRTLSSSREGSKDKLDALLPTPPPPGAAIAAAAGDETESAAAAVSAAEDAFGAPAPAAAPPAAPASVVAPSSSSSSSSTAPSSSSSSEPPTLPEDVAKTAELWGIIRAGEAAEPMIRRAIIVGNFEAAVECCLEAGLMAEALLLAQCGDQALRVRTQAAFFEKRRHEHPFLNVLHAVIRNELMNYVLSSELPRWKETLALLSTYGKSEEFPALCEALAARLESELNDSSSATLCYMCAANVARTVGFWTAELNAANEALGQTDTIALQNYIEKVVVFTHANPVDNLGPECLAYFAKYAELLANQGRLGVALSYMKGHNLVEEILIDRLYHAGEKAAGSRPPPFPFTKVPLQVNPQQQSIHQQPVAASSSNSNLSAAASATAGAGAGAAAAMASKSPTLSTAATGGGRGGSNRGNAAAMAAVSAAANASSSNTAATTAAATAAATAADSSSAAAAASAAAGGYVLPAGWVQLIDPNSNHPYYVNQGNGQSQWEAPPSAAPAVVAAPAPAAAAAMASPMSNASAAANGAAAGSSGYSGVGAVDSVATNMARSSLSSPLAAGTSAGGGLGGNMGMGPLSDATAASSMPAAGVPGGAGGSAAAAGPAATTTTTTTTADPAVATVGGAVGGSSSATSVSGGADNANAPYILQLNEIIKSLQAVVKSPMEKKQMGVVAAAYEILVEQIGRGEVSQEVMMKVAALVEYLSTRNFPAASQLQTDLANTVWAQHKEWIKGIKVLNQLAAKK